ncbi:hypothetical protein C8N46_10358 [Kordia periserrulae]|uniref:Riboflavin synthase subunit beta n=1 Tax=Kordia periserrulae TaxID=701523 RepID=A0A2T6C0X2_9FLAO|nr:hypothetical protein [Kordia periserrulae]PTX61961.1 hypothetical protein C8N46_10358 [Kordia periserrulae]
MLGGFFRKRKNRTFNYTPQFYKPEEDRSLPDRSFAKYRRAWEDAGEASRTRKNYEVSVRLIIIFLVLVFIALYILDFDLSIFYSK